MTAIATGAKTRLGVIGVGQGALRGDCASARGTALLSIVELAESAGLATGIVTTTRITHATPASVYAHVPDRNWEDDAHLPAAARAAGCSDIASQLVSTPFGDGPEVLFGGGRARFQPTSVRDPEYDDQAGLRLDGRDLVAEAVALDGVFGLHLALVGEAVLLLPADMPFFGHVFGGFAHAVGVVHIGQARVGEAPAERVSYI